MTTRQRALAAALALALAPLPAAAQTASSLQPRGLIAAADPARIAAEMQKLGYPVTVSTDGTGDPLITSSTSSPGRTINFEVYFYGCTNGASCTAIQFSAGWTTAGIDITIVNDWNRSMRYGRAYIDEVNDPIIAMDINLSEGISPALFADNLRIWAQILPSFAEKVGG